MTVDRDDSQAAGRTARRGVGLAAPLALSLLAACKIFPWPGDPQPPSHGGATIPLPEPKLAETVEGMILQTYYLVSSRRADRLALRRCAHVDGGVDRCEITFVEQGRIVDRVPTFARSSRGTEDWDEQGKAASAAVRQTIERRFGDDRIALARTGVFGVATPPEGMLSARLVEDRVELVAGSPPRVLATTTAPGMCAVLDRFVSERAPDVYAVRLTGATDTSQRGPEALVVFRRLGADDYRVVAHVPPLD
ncbi:hypothetical protein [Nannocystis sp. SCPEA4]|uniref:hypothetical protein n=1 Tax=Nannocystis sp. SCPEA4 TaxID=2996787 RepID=UPI00227104A0|nr:hypothetical protein [Nannocystis sp. SCPEA4]MCY1055677.1 hypothetical protein [Nannocystis sp. SCPEA4]